MNQPYTILVNSSDGFDDCWQPFFTLLKRYWPACDAPILLNTERKTAVFSDLPVQCTQVQRADEGRLSWSECLLRALDQVQTPLVMYFQEDYFLDKPADDARIREAVSFMMEHADVKHVALTRHGSLGPYDPYPAAPGMQAIRQKARYRISTQAALWRVDTLRSYLRSEESGWMFEIYGTWRAQRRNETFLCLNFDEAAGGPALDYVHTGIVKGKWLRDIVPVFEANGIDIDFARRGFYQPKPYLLHKYELARKLLEHPGYLLKQLV
ncbi:hypothetical protein AB870_10340 [Pandoraea faecigallinarum]|uniref:Glycosyl transferase family 2 n=1 Tax=Pandoraea faecigallinarum TaxID=656179 RepID=A0A0H3WQH8_9BURK|nr:hypothetical protein [Pandoraea faecigallinarum]AKM30419.1 hypothetical protein AB870_10340 [Pandoraea faecigallinarum]